jgi:hypothetical protein
VIGSLPVATLIAHLGDRSSHSPLERCDQAARNSTAAPHRYARGTTKVAHTATGLVYLLDSDGVD